MDGHRCELLPCACRPGRWGQKDMPSRLRVSFMRAPVPPHASLRFFASSLLTLPSPPRHPLHSCPHLWPEMQRRQSTASPKR